MNKIRSFTVKIIQKITNLTYDYFLFKRYSVEKKFSEANQTIIQLEIMEADVNDSGVYELVAKNQEGETQSQTVELTSEQVEMSLKVTLFFRYPQIFEEKSKV